MPGIHFRLGLGRGASAPEAGMGFVRVRKNGRPLLSAGADARAFLDATLAWSRGRDDVTAVALLSAPAGADPQGVVEILLLVRDRMTLVADEAWHEAALGGRCAAGRTDSHFQTVSSRLLRLVEGTCVQFWVADAPQDLVTQPQKKSARRRVLTD